LTAYLREVGKDDKAQAMLVVARTALALDPLRPRISAAERRARVLRLFADAQQRIQSCAVQLGATPPPDIQTALTKLSAEAPNASDRALRRDPDLVEDLFSTSADALIITAKWCQARHPADDAVTAIAQLHGVRP
jgi:hypothetical protein